MLKFPSLKLLLVIVLTLFILGLTSTLTLSYLTNTKLTAFLNLTKQTEPETLFPLSPITKEPSSLILSISTPSEDKLVFEPDILIQGKASPKSLVILSLNNSEEVLELNNGDNFSSTVKLTDGLNYLLIGVFDQSGKSKIEERTIYYSKEKL